MNKGCQNCGCSDRIAGERFCADCKKLHLKEIRAQHRPEPKVRTLSDRGTEDTGRSPLEIAYDQQWDWTCNSAGYSNHIARDTYIDGHPVWLEGI